MNIYQKQTALFGANLRDNKNMKKIDSKKENLQKEEKITQFAR